MANQSASQSSELSRILLDVLFCNADKRLFSHKTCRVCYKADENKARVLRAGLYYCCKKQQHKK